MLAKKKVSEKKRVLQEQMNREIMARQQQILKLYQRRLSGKNMQALQNFAASGKQPGSSEFFKLNPTVQKVVLKLNLASMDVMSKHTKNPLKKVLIAFQKKIFAKMADGKKPKKK